MESNRTPMNRRNHRAGCGRCGTDLLKATTPRLPAALSLHGRNAAGGMIRMPLWARFGWDFSFAPVCLEGLLQLPLDPPAEPASNP